MYKSLSSKVLLLVLCTVQCSLLHGMLSLGSKYKKLSVGRRFNKESLAKFVRYENSEIIRWNKSGDKCAWITIDDSRFAATKVHLCLAGLVKGGIEVKCESWDDFYFPLIKDKGRPSLAGQDLGGLQDKVYPFFDEIGRACFYGYGYSAGHKDLSIIEYTLDFDGSARYRCLYEIPDKYDRSFQDFRVIFNFPVLVKALLQSKMVSYELPRPLDSLWKIFKLQGTTLPQDYKHCQKDIPSYDSLMTGCFDYLSYDQLPAYLRHAFDKKHRE